MFLLPEVWPFNHWLQHGRQQVSFQNQPKSQSRSPTVQSVVQKVSDCLKPFVFKGFLSLTGKVEDQHLVTVLWDVACSLSLILSVLPLSGESLCNVNAMVRGIEMGFIFRLKPRFHKHLLCATRLDSVCEVFHPVWSMVFTSPFSGHNVVPDRCLHTCVWCVCICMHACVHLGV